MTNDVSRADKARLKKHKAAEVAKTDTVEFAELKGRKPNPFDQFYANPTPANAVELAIADWRATHQPNEDLEFFSALWEAHRLLKQLEAGEQP